jgi:hypothetical protein
MKILKSNKIVTSIFIIFFLNACAVSDFVDIPNVSGCIRDCNEQSRLCLDIETDCPSADLCFKSLDQCFQETNGCNKKCNNCEDNYTCVNIDDCRQACADKGTACTSMINLCVDETLKCVDTLVNVKEDCLSGEEGFVECVAYCVETLENELD